MELIKQCKTIEEGSVKFWPCLFAHYRMVTIYIWSFYSSDDVYILYCYSTILAYRYTTACSKKKTDITSGTLRKTLRFLFFQYATLLVTLQSNTINILILINFLNNCIQECVGLQNVGHEIVACFRLSVYCNRLSGKQASTFLQTSKNVAIQFTAVSCWNEHEQ